MWHAWKAGAEEHRDVEGSGQTHKVEGAWKAHKVEGAGQEFVGAGQTCAGVDKEGCGVQWAFYRRGGKAERARLQLPASVLEGGCSQSVLEGGCSQSVLEGGRSQTVLEGGRKQTECGECGVTTYHTPGECGEERGRNRGRMQMERGRGRSLARQSAPARICAESRPQSPAAGTQSARCPPTASRPSAAGSRRGRGRRRTRRRSRGTLSSKTPRGTGRCVGTACATHAARRAWGYGKTKSVCGGWVRAEQRECMCGKGRVAGTAAATSPTHNLNPRTLHCLDPGLSLFPPFPNHSQRMCMRAGVAAAPAAAPAALHRPQCTGRIAPAGVHDEAARTPACFPPHFPPHFPPRFRTWWMSASCVM
eukprot:363298-Chlamydomonas_euryale.AAC.2